VLALLKKLLDRPRYTKSKKKPRICILVDAPGWAYDNVAQQIRKQLADEFNITIEYRTRKPKLDPVKYDLLHVCFWGEEYYKQFGFAQECIIKEISSHRWQYDAPYGPITVDEFGERYLTDCDTAICTSARLLKLISSIKDRAYFTPNGVDIARFNRSRKQRAGLLRYGWAGNAADSIKGYHDIVEPACTGRTLLSAKGQWSYWQMPHFYNDVDIFIVASRHEGGPLPLLEAMAAGCFPVCTDVGIVPELIEHMKNGFIVRDATVDAFREAFEWCEANIARVMAGGRANAEFVALERNWPVCAQYYARAYKATLLRVQPPKFRNDDVSWDTSLEDLKRLSAVFHKYGLTQVHGICLYGCTNANYRLGEVATEYEGYDTISRLSNSEIRQLSTGKEIRTREDLIGWLNDCQDEVALHGLYHTDYSVMSLDEQESDIAEGLDLMRHLFPNKRVKFFIAPFNRTNKDTYVAAARKGLELLAAEGVQLEADLDHLELEPSKWYRYHHHRFYPESRFDFYKLSIEKLEAALDTCFSSKPRSFGLLESSRRSSVGRRVLEDKLRASGLFDSAQGLRSRLAAAMKSRRGH
jgi:glycosyltransferase involved in cell wall biosynthesis